MLRIVIAEDSVTLRQLLVDILRSDPDIEVVGEAANGAEAVDMARSLRPDVVAMDIHMPHMDGFEATKRIMIEAPTPIVIISGSTGANEVEISMNALRAGALTVLPKPPGPLAEDFEEHKRRFIGAIRAMSQVKVVRHWPDRPAPQEAPPSPSQARRAGVIAIAASTGGPAALSRVLSDLPRDIRVPILMVQHITPGFTEGLAQWLNKNCPLRVRIARNGELLTAGMAYLSPDGFHMGLSSRSLIQLSEEAPIGGFRPSGNFLFSSVGRAFGAAGVGVILTGMGRDGIEGLGVLRGAGGRVIAQDERTSVVFGMPKAAIEAGVADHVLPLAAIGPKLVQWL